MASSDVCVTIPIDDDGSKLLLYHVAGQGATSWWATGSCMSTLGVDMACLPIGSKFYVGEDSVEYEVVEAAGQEEVEVDDDFDLTLVHGSVSGASCLGGVSCTSPLHLPYPTPPLTVTAHALQAAIDVLEGRSMSVHRQQLVEVWRRDRRAPLASAGGAVGACSIVVSLATDQRLQHATTRNFSMRKAIAITVPMHKDVQHRLKQERMADITTNHVMTLLAQYWGFLTNMRNCSRRDCNSSAILGDPQHLAAFWRYLATPSRLGGRGNARSWVETRVTYMGHILRVLRLLGLPCAPGHQWQEVETWWRVEVARLSRCARRCCTTMRAQGMRGRPQQAPTRPNRAPC